MSDDPLLDVAANLRAIRDLHDDLPAQAANHATATLMPGGLAMVALGPVASLEAVGNVVDTAETRRPKWLDEIGDNDDDWEPPLQTLRFWAESWRTEWHREVDVWTVETESVFLLGVLPWAFKHEPHWADFCKDVANARRRLEDVLHDGERVERSRVPCIDCEADRTGGPIAVRLVLHYDRNPDNDRWVCPRCKRKYDAAAFLRAQLVDGARRGTERFVSVTMAADALQLSRHRIRTLVTACELPSRTLLVWWPDARALRQEGSHESP